MRIIFERLKINKSKHSYLLVSYIFKQPFSETKLFIKYMNNSAFSMNEYYGLNTIFIEKVKKMEVRYKPLLIDDHVALPLSG